MDESDDSQWELDPVYVSSIGELKWIVGIWTVSILWIVGFCSVYGYAPDEPLSIVMGMPWWVFWGVFVPWIVTAVFSCWFAIYKMADHRLDDSDPSESADV